MTSRVVGCVGVRPLDEPLSASSGVGRQPTPNSPGEPRKEGPTLGNWDEQLADGCCSTKVGQQGSLKSEEPSTMGNSQVIGRSYELKRMFIDPEFHGKGLAQHLLKAVEDFVFVEEGGRSIGLSTGADMPRACRFYEKMGYRLLRVEQTAISSFYPAVSSDLVLPINFYEKTNEIESKAKGHSNNT